MLAYSFDTVHQAGKYSIGSYFGLGIEIESVAIVFSCSIHSIGVGLFNQARS